MWPKENAYEWELFSISCIMEKISRRKTLEVWGEDKLGRSGPEVLLERLSWEVWSVADKDSTIGK